MRCFTVNYDQLNGILSPLFFISQPQDTRGFVPLNKIAFVNPPRPTLQIKLDEKVPYVGLPETDDGKIIEVLFRPYREVKGRNYFIKDDVLFARIEPSVFNQKYIYVGDLKENDYAFTSTEFYIVKAKEEADQKYIFYMLFTDQVFEQIKGKTTGSTGRRRLDKSAFEKTLIPYPNKETRAKIVEILEKAHKQREEKLKQADELLNSIDDFVRQHLGIDYKEPEEEKIYTVNSQGLENNRQDPYYYNPKFAKLLNSVGSNLKMASLSDIAEGVFNGNTPAKDNYTDEGKPIVKVSCLKKNKIEWSNLAYAKDKKLNKHLRDNDILLLSSAHQAEYLGKNPCLVEIPDNLKETDITFVGELICIRPNTKLVNSYYLLAILRLDEYHLLINREKRGQTSHIYPDDLEKIKVPLPDKRKQDAIAQEFKNRLNKTASLKNEASKQLEDAKKKVEEMILN
jgi:restriction endonuclease S subunit